MPSLLDHRQRRLELLAAVAAQRVEDVAGEALGVDPDQDVLGAGHVALDHRDVVLVVDQGAVADGGELPEGGRQLGRDDPLDQLLGAPPIGDQVGDRDHLQVVLRAVVDQVGHARHRPVLVHHLADHPGRDQAGEPGEVDRRLGLTGALQDAAVLRLQREDVARLDQVPRLGVRIDRHLDRPRPVGGRDPGGDALASLDGDREGGLERRLVLGGHQVEAELLAALVGQREADQAAAVLRHEVDGLGRRELRRHRQVALVLPVLVVADDHHPPAADVLDRLLDRWRTGNRSSSSCLLGALGHLGYSSVIRVTGSDRYQAGGGRSGRGRRTRC